MSAHLSCEAGASQRSASRSAVLGSDGSEWLEGRITLLKMCRAKACQLFRKFRMMRHDVIAPGMKDERFSVGTHASLYPAQENIVIAAIETPDFSANKTRGDPLQQRNPRFPFFAVNPFEFVRDGRSELMRQCELVGSQNVDREVAGFPEGGKILRIPRQTPQDQRRIQRNGSKGRRPVGGGSRDRFRNEDWRYDSGSSQRPGTQRWR